MNKNKKPGNNKKDSSTNFFDVLCKLIDGFVNILTPIKIGALMLLWMVVRDAVFVLKLPNSYNYGDNLISYLKICEYLFQSDNKIIIILSGIVYSLVIAVIFLIVYIVLLKKEINRISETRSKAMHETEEGKGSKLKRHTSSKGFFAERGEQT